MDDSKAQLGQIMYSQEYRTVLGTLRALLAAKEYSERALAVTSHAISLNPAHYTVWQYRYHIIRHFAELQKTPELKAQYIEKELEYNEGEAISHPKNYQIWNYRELLMKLNPHPNPKKEFPIIEAIIIEDNKNYHTWSYRTWLVTYFQLYKEDSEINFVNILLSKDIRNNSAWNFRFFLKFSSATHFSSDEEIAYEIKYTKRAISDSPQNSSAWNYLLGVYDVGKRDLDDLEEFCLQFVDFDNLDVTEEEKNEKESGDFTEPIVKSVYAMEALQKIYEQKEKSKSLKALNLLSKVDPIRVNYWNYKKSLLGSV